MQSGKIPNSRLKASSQRGLKRGPRQGRLHGDRCWTAGQKNASQWLRVDFKHKATVTKILTQGCKSANQWVKSYTVGYSDDGTNFKTYKENNGQNKVRNTRDDCVKQ